LFHFKVTLHDTFVTARGIRYNSKFLIHVLLLFVTVQ